MSPGSRSDSCFAAGERLAAKESSLRLRSRILQGIRSFFTQEGYLEVETPLLIPAPAPELHIDAVQAGDLFLHTSPELCMKRLLASGYEKIFQICRCFREGERGANHLPEFTILEWYRAGADYRSLMSECEEMLLSLSMTMGSGERLSYRNRDIDLRRPWPRLTVKDAFLQYANMPLEVALATGDFDEIMVTRIEPHLGTPRPTFLCDYPASLAALARTKRNEPESAERFELYLAGLELANAFSELTDAEEQRGRFEREREERRRLGKKVYPAPDKFLEALPFMPESAGIALGVDRLIMVFADRKDIDSVVAFTPEEL
ncbi:MAG: EF-P lysine aminoacylase EpmA [Desulfatiglandales bacterium]